MRISIACIGRMKAGAERDLLDRYLQRARQTGRGLGITQVSVTEHVESRAQQTDARKADEARQLLQAVPPGARLVVLDEHGKSVSSTGFSDKLEAWKNESVPDVVFVIGGADGLGSEVLARADMKIALGSMTWPHQIVRILIAEQIYRAMTIQSGHPYHRQ